MLIYYFIFFFFFQAEDGIRDWSVTGVQTCALPICPGTPRAISRSSSSSVDGSAHCRSEERREGKSVDLGGRRIIKKKKKKNKNTKNKQKKKKKKKQMKSRNAKKK